MDENTPSILRDLTRDAQDYVKTELMSPCSSKVMREAASVEPGHYFARSITEDKKNPMNLIAEFKRASPSRGDINQYADPIKTVRAYEWEASAISVLTNLRFGGSLDDLRTIRRETGKPLLRKDFIVHPYQIYESNVAGADAILLIAGILDTEQLRDYRQAAEELGMDALVEVHNRQELDKALESEAYVIGINNRDLNTFNANLDTTMDLMSHVPGDKILVTESGITSLGDVRKLTRRKKKPNAMLVGAYLMEGGNPRERARRLLGKK